MQSWCIHSELEVMVNFYFSFSFVGSLPFFWTCLLNDYRETFPTWLIPHIYGTYNILSLGIKWLRFITWLVSWVIWNRYPFHLKCSSTSQVSSGYLNFSRSRALFCYVRRSKSLKECVSFVLSFIEMLVFPVQTDGQLPFHIQIYFVAVFNSNMAPFLQLLLLRRLLMMLWYAVLRQILHVREVNLFISNPDSFLKYICLLSGELTSPACRDIL
jgi:hypothetical protein